MLCAKEMLRKTCSKVGKLYRDSVDPPDMLTRLKSIGAELDSLHRARGEHRAYLYQLDDLAPVCETTILPVLDAEGGIMYQNTAGTNDAVQRADKNLKAFQISARSLASMAVLVSAPCEMFYLRTCTDQTCKAIQASLTPCNTFCVKIRIMERAHCRCRPYVAVEMVLADSAIHPQDVEH